ncbi:hypothetical protein [Litoribrevibacter albus]|uniref:DUF3857 domain-containing protein n=1 Tax=Litoribrevibacter albus TaxID=1473156 RepID=A0AA37W5T7_9GAMM|nr:hypothetical protein [Litoribrevibacter albus]GLQ29788.1 hypothetical protein GCM10007876_02660 [Litoribrevibacter albus]
MKHSTLVSLLAALPLAISAASIQQASASSDEFLKWKEQTMSSYQAYKDERDKAFTDFLKKQWKQVDTKEGEVRDTQPKPVSIPVAKPKPVEVNDLPVVEIPKKIKPIIDLPKPDITTPEPVVSTPTPKHPQPSTPIEDKKPAQQLPDFDLPQTPEPDFDQITKADPMYDQPDFDQPGFDQPDFDSPDFGKDIKPEIPELKQPAPIKIEQPITIEELPRVEDIPTPEVTPTVPPAPIVSPTPIAPPVPIVKDVTPTPPPVIVPKQPKAPVYSGKKYQFDFFGRSTIVYADKKLAASLGRTYNAKAIAKGWSDLSLSDYEPVLEQLAKISKQHNLGDWGKVQLAFALSKAMHPGDINAQSFTSWFLLVKQDYQARLAYNNAGIYLLVPAEQSLYEVTFFTFGGKRFYAVSPDGKPRYLGRVYTYDGEYPRAIVQVNMKDPLAFGDEQHYQKRTFKFKYNRQQYQVTLNVNPTRVNYLASYPQMDIDQYFVSPVDMVTANDALDLFRPMLQGKSELDAVNLLLRFVQTGFEYQTDDQQFGFENYLFAEETLTMPASDCEDRSVLFAWLVRELLGLEVVGLDYPGHIAAAVAFSKPVPGDSIAYNGKRYTITDPTYINANAGMTMPEVAGHQPKVVAIQ